MQKMQKRQCHLGRPILRHLRQILLEFSGPRLVVAFEVDESGAAQKMEPNQWGQRDRPVNVVRPLLALGVGGPLSLSLAESKDRRVREHSLLH
jgi:hypothetical protein